MFKTNEIIAVNLIVIVRVALNYQQTNLHEMFGNAIFNFRRHARLVMGRFESCSLGSYSHLIQFQIRIRNLIQYLFISFLREAFK